MKEKVLKTIKKYQLIDKGDKIVLGVSGGPDSMCMLDVLNEIKKTKVKFEIVVAHINHQIRKEAKQDEEYVKKFCQKRGIQFYAKSIDVLKIANTNKIGTEEAGRKVRYEFFEEIATKTKSNKIAIAHNKNDKVETVIMHFLRGTGINGLQGIQAKRNQYIRPLIECTRQEIENYCKQKNLEPRIDQTNFENIYTRNKIRNELIPHLQKEYNPNLIETINRLANIIEEEEEERQKEVQKKYQAIRIEERKNQITLDLKKFNEQEKVIKARLILYTITRIFGTTKGIERIHVQDMIKLCENNIGNKYLTPNKHTKILIQNHKIYFIRQK